MGADASGAAIAVIEPESFFATTYVLRFPRSFINPRKFSFSVEASVSDGGSTKAQLRAASATVVISPWPYVLSLIAVLSALLGTSLKFAIESAELVKISAFFENLGTYIVTAPGISGAVLALVIFNVYEYLEVGSRIKMGVGWRSAMLIGVLCGLFSERMIAALEALVGT